jgi:repressor LexA
VIVRSRPDVDGADAPLAIPGADRPPVPSSGFGAAAMADFDSLTPRQREIYNFIRSKIQGRGYGPTVREIGLQFQIKSPNGVMCHLKALQKKGLIHREPNMSRAIQLLEDPATARPAGLKLVGRIAAGAPIEAVEQDEELAFSEWEGSDDKFALRVTGDSMIEEHIADGDFVVIQRQEQARDGQIVAVRDEEGEATLKRFFREPARNRVRLEPANKTMKPIYRDRVNILGVLVGVVRKY